MIAALWGGLTVLLAVLFPWLIVFSPDHWPRTPMWLALFALAAWRLRHLLRPLGAYGLLGLLLIPALLYLLRQQPGVLLYYPVLVSCAFLLVFGGSLHRGPPMVERFARMTEPALPAKALPYTRKVTQVWCVFFVINGTLAAISCLDARWWAWYNGGIAYGLMGALMGGEWLVRQRAKRHWYHE